MSILRKPLIKVIDFSPNHNRPQTEYNLKFEGYFNHDAKVIPDLGGIFIIYKCVKDPFKIINIIDIQDCYDMYSQLNGNHWYANKMKGEYLVGDFGYRVKDHQCLKVSFAQLPFEEPRRAIVNKLLTDLGHRINIHPLTEESIKELNYKELMTVNIYGKTEKIRNKKFVIERLDQLPYYRNSDNHRNVNQLKEPVQ